MKLDKAPFEKAALQAEQSPRLPYGTSTCKRPLLPPRLPEKVRITFAHVPIKTCIMVKKHDKQIMQLLTDSIAPTGRGRTLKKFCEDEDYNYTKLRRYVDKSFWNASKTERDSIGCQCVPVEVDTADSKPSQSEETSEKSKDKEEAHISISFASGTAQQRVLTFGWKHRPSNSLSCHDIT